MADEDMGSDGSSSRPSSPAFEDAPARVNPITQGHNFIDEVQAIRDELDQLQPEPLARQFADVHKSISDMNTNLTNLITELTNTVANLATTVNNNHQATILRQDVIETNTQARILNSNILSDTTPLYPLVDTNNSVIDPFPLNRNQLRGLVPEAINTLLNKLGITNIPHFITQRLDLIQNKIGISTRY